MATPFEDLGFDPEILGPEQTREKTVRQKLLSTARRAARQIPFIEDVVAGYYCAIDPKSPTRVRASLLAALGYFVLPLDMVPDLLIGIGFGDDATVLLAALAMVRSHMNEGHYEAARKALDANKI